MNARSKWLTIAMGFAALLLAGCQTQAPEIAMKEVMTQDTGNMRITVMSPTGELSQGKNAGQILFRATNSDQPADVGTVSLSGSMSMPGMAPMVAPIELKKEEPGKYSMQGTFDMSGSWMFDVHWDGPAGQGNTSFHASVR